jgi:hypothetical protein
MYFSYLIITDILIPPEHICKKMHGINEPISFPLHTPEGMVLGVWHSNHNEFELIT